MKKSFTLIEMVFSLGILAVVVLSFVLSVVQFSSMNETSENSTLALNAALSRIDLIRESTSGDSFFTGAIAACGTEVLGSSSSVTIGRAGTVSVYLTCKKDLTNTCTGNLFDFRTVVCWLQTNNLRVGTSSGGNCVSSPVEVRSSILVK